MNSVWWVKRDFRVSDNECLSRALLNGGEVTPFFCWEPKIVDSGDYSIFHFQAQWQALEGLTEELNVRGSNIWVACGEVTNELDNLLKKYSFTHLYSHEETGNLISFQRDREVARWCKMRGIIWTEISQNSVLRGGNAQMRRKNSTSLDLRKTKPIPSPKQIRSPLTRSVPIRKWGWNELGTRLPKFSGCSMLPALQKVNEKNAWATLGSFFGSRAYYYSGGISSPNKAFQNGSRLSVHLAWGYH